MVLNPIHDGDGDGGPVYDTLYDSIKPQNEAPSVPVPSHTTATAAADSAEPAGDESYMVMNSACTVLSSIKNIGSTPQDDA